MKTKQNPFNLRAIIRNVTTNLSNFFQSIQSACPSPSQSNPPIKSPVPNSPIPQLTKSPIPPFIIPPPHQIPQSPFPQFPPLPPHNLHTYSIHTPYIPHTNLIGIDTLFWKQKKGKTNCPIFILS